jgi:hypothetical protein
MDLFLRNKSKLENCRFGLFGNIKESAVSMKQLAKNPKLEKLFFFKISKKIEDLGSTPKPSFMQNHGEAKKHVQEDKKNRRWTVLN